MLQSLFPLDLGRRARTIRRRKVLLLLRHRWLWLSLRRWLRRWLLRWLRCWLRWRRFTALPPLALEAQLRQQIVHAGTAPSAITLAEARRSSFARILVDVCADCPACSGTSQWWFARPHARGPRGRARGPDGLGEPLPPVSLRQRRASSRHGRVPGRLILGCSWLRRRTDTVSVTETPAHQHSSYQRAQGCSDGVAAGQPADYHTSALLVRAIAVPGASGVR
jgi:hypothetical protein